jgi:hypothetical protein
VVRPINGCLGPEDFISFLKLSNENKRPAAMAREPNFCTQGVVRASAGVIMLAVFFLQGDSQVIV